MLHTPFTPFRNAFIRDLKEVSDEELLELFYTSLRWVNYFQDEDDLFIYLKIFEDVFMEVKRRKLRYRWSNKDIKKYRILGQKMYYGSLSVKELEWRLGFIILYVIPVHRKFVKNKMYLVRERIHIIIEAIHQQNCWSELEYNKDILQSLNVPVFSYDNFRDIYQTLKTLFLLCENIIIFCMFIFYALLRHILILWIFIDPYNRCLKNIAIILQMFVIIFFVSCYMRNMMYV